MPLRSECFALTTCASCALLLNKFVPNHYMSAARMGLYTINNLILQYSIHTMQIYEEVSQFDARTYNKFTLDELSQLWPAVSFRMIISGG